MNDKQTQQLLKKHAAAYGDAAYEPARWVLDSMQDAVAVERERCARLCDAHSVIRAASGFPREASAARVLAELIRA